MIEQAKKYRKAGLDCLPTKENKAPACKSWKLTVDINEFKDVHGIGLVCGKRSFGLECMDFDNHFGDAKKNISEFIEIPEVKEIYKKYNLPIQQTISGGYHLLFRCSFNEGNKKLAQRAKWTGDKFIPDCLIETRGEGGYFVASPTKGYTVARNDIFDVQEITKQEREILIQYACSFNEWHEPAKHEPEQKDRPGDIFNNDINSLNEVKNCLLNNGWQELKQGYWTRPDKQQKGISATLGYKNTNIFYVFSANGYPFEPMKGYTPFQVIAMLKYKADFKLFASELAKKYGLNNGNQDKKPEKKKDFEDLLLKSFIDLTIPIERPPTILYIKNIFRNKYVKQRLLSLGNFSAIIGKAKAKKTFCSSMLVAPIITGGSYYDKFFAEIPSNKKMVLRFDTEQSEYDAYIAGKRIYTMAGLNCPDFGVFDLREYTPQERCDIIDSAFKKFKENICFVLIDGITDLAYAINDEVEATRVVSLLMKWTKVYNCHIMVIIHQNKNDLYATGHLGSFIMKKAEVVISVEKDANDIIKSTVKCDYIRGAPEFNDFNFEIDAEGIPVIHEYENINYEDFTNPLTLDI